MYVIEMSLYTLILSYNPCDIFTYYNVEKMHGLSASECHVHENNESQAYIAGWCNYAPKESGEYVDGDRVFVFINLSRCTDDVHTMGLIMHEMMHLSFLVNGSDVEEDEEEIITWAEEQSYEVYKLVKPLLGKVARQAITKSE
jgi:hypothetical protein